MGIFSRDDHTFRACLINDAACAYEWEHELIDEEIGSSILAKPILTVRVSHELSLHMDAVEMMQTSSTTLYLI